MTRAPSYPLSLGGVHVTVNRGEYQDAVVEGLRQAGIPIAEGPEDLYYMLTVRIGASRGFATDCGTIRNVRYTLYYAFVPQARAQVTELRTPVGPVWSTHTVSQGAQAIQMAARDRDGHCASNVFNQMGAALREQMAGEVKVIDPDDRFYDEDPRFTPLNKSWVHPSHASDSDVYYANLKECMDEARIASSAAGATYDHDRFDVCMKALGWRPGPEDRENGKGGVKAASPGD